MNNIPIARHTLGDGAVSSIAPCDKEAESYHSIPGLSPQEVSDAENKILAYMSSPEKKGLLCTTESITAGAELPYELSIVYRILLRMRLDKKIRITYTTPKTYYYFSGEQAVIE